jgi:hypothetical protein
MNKNLKRFMKIWLILYLKVAGIGFAQTNQIFVTDNISTDFNIFVPTTNQAWDASSLKESRPAKDDPEGHWGEVWEGFQLSLRLDKETYTNGEPINADVLLRNVSEKPVKFFFFEPKDRPLQLIVKKLTKNTSNDAAGELIQEIQSRHLTGSLWRLTIPIGKQRKFVIGLTNVFDLTPGKYKIQAQQLVMNLERTVTTNVASGYATFTVVNTQ